MQYRETSFCHYINLKKTTQQVSMLHSNTSLPAQQHIAGTSAAQQHIAPCLLTNYSFSQTSY